MKVFNLTDNQVQTIINALAECPYKLVIETMDTIQIQYMEQVKNAEITEEIVNIEGK